MELINNPDILILDEPTSGLSSYDAFEIIQLLRNLSDQGKIILVVIHQPSSDIYRLFNKLLVLNNGGKLAYFGDSMEALNIFRNIINSTEIVECPVCQKVNPDILVKTLKKEVTSFWKILSFINNKVKEPINDSDDDKDIIQNLEIKNKPLNFSLKISQLMYQFIRLFLIKFRDKVNIIVTLLAAPFLGSLIAIILRNGKNPIYTFSENTQYILYLNLLVIVSLFFGLINSITEITKDRLIIKRDWLNKIPISGYLFSKIFVLVIFAFIQSILFIVSSHIILEEYDFILIHIALMTVITISGIATGLFFSSIIKSLTAAYNLIPILLIPQIILGGGFIDFDKINKDLYFFDKKSDIALTLGKVPEISNLILARWLMK